MAVTNKIEVVGIKQALAELNTFDKKYRRGVTSRYRQIVQPMVNDAKNLIPVKAPMSGFNRAWTPRSGRSREPLLPWGTHGGKNIKPFISGKRPKTFGGYTRNLAAFGIRWGDRTSVLFDASGQSETESGAQMISTLGARYGSPSRAMWRAYNQSSIDIQNDVAELVEDIFKQIGKNINVER
jgi:hypothetical protein